MLADRFAGCSVLIIEDESFTRLVLTRMLEKLGFAKVHQAADGAAGLANVDATHPDIILCDVEMEPMDGVAFLEELHRRPAGHPPVAFLTNRIDPQRAARARELGATVFLPKPAQPDALAAALDQLLS